MDCLNKGYLQSIRSPDGLSNFLLKGWSVAIRLQYPSALAFPGNSGCTVGLVSGYLSNRVRGVR